jgi:Uma2 family endonuclease
LPDWADYELIDGVLAPFHGGALASSVSVQIVCSLGDWVKATGYGRTLGPKTTYACFPGRPNLVRRSSLSVVRYGRLPNNQLPRHGPITVEPDVVIDVMTPRHGYEEVEQKVADFRAAGVRLIWVVSPGSRTVVVRRLDGTCAEVGEAGELSGEDVIPGFTCKVAELFV